MRNILISLIVLLVVCCIHTSASGATKTATSSGSWGTAATWSPSGVPGASDDVVIDNGATVTVNVNGSCATVLLGSSSGPNKGTGALTFNSGISLTVTSSLTLGVVGNGSNSRAGTITMTSGGTLTCGRLINGYSGTLTSGTGTIIFTGNDTIPTAFTTFNNLEISSGTTTLAAGITVNGHVTLSGGMFTLGVHNVLSKGDWTFSGGSLNSSSTVTLGGTSLQHIINSGQFCLLTINNSAGVTCSSLGVSQTLTMTKGVLAVSGTLTTGTAAGGSDSSYVDGTLSQNVTGSDTSYYPIGNHGYSPVKVFPTSGGNMLSISAIQGYPPSAFGSNVLSRYWAVGGSVLTVDMIFQYPASEVHGTESAFQAGRYNGLSWDVLPSSCDPSAHTVTAIGVDNFNYIAVGEGSSLPIQLTSPGAVVDASLGVALSWSTVTETNNLGFTVERKAEHSSAYTSVSAFIAGAGTSLEPHYYSFIDASVAPGTYYYRIQQKDANGSTCFSPEIKVVVTAVLGAPDPTHPSTFGLAGNYPNPFNPSTTIAFEVPEAGQASIVVYNMMGQEVATVLRVSPLSAGEHSVSFDAGALPSGHYFYRLTFNSSNRAFTGVHSMVLIK